MNKQIFNRPLALKTERFALPELGVDAFVTLKQLSARELLTLQHKHGSEGKGTEFDGDFFALALVDDGGKPLFDTPEECRDHITALPLGAIQRMQKAAYKLCGISYREEDDPKN